MISTVALMQEKEPKPNLNPLFSHHGFCVVIFDVWTLIKADLERILQNEMEKSRLEGCRARNWAHPALEGTPFRIRNIYVVQFYFKLENDPYKPTPVFNVYW